MSWSPDGLRTEAQVYSGLEFIPLKVSRLYTYVFGEWGGASQIVRVFQSSDCKIFLELLLLKIQVFEVF